MSDYRCTKSFNTTLGKKYYTGDLINEDTYDNLTYDCQRSFEEEPSILEDFVPLDSYSSVFEDFNTSNNSFEGFDGGDSGGGGASGDW